MLNILKWTSPAAGIGTGRDGSMLVRRIETRQRKRRSRRASDGKNLVQRRHIDFLEHQIRWRWLLDSYEGGDRYRNAVYGPDRKGTAVP